MAFFLQTDNGTGTILEMDATLNVDYRLNATPTRYAVEAGANASDHYQRAQPMVSFSGIVSEVKFFTPDGPVVTLEDFERALIDLRNGGQFFACSFSQNLEILRNCLFTSLSIRSTPETGPDAREISFNIVQVEQAQQAQNTVLPVPAERFQDIVQVRSRGTGSSTQPEEEATRDLTSQVERLSGVSPGIFRFIGN